MSRPEIADGGCTLAPSLDQRPHPGTSSRRRRPPCGSRPPLRPGVIHLGQRRSAGPLSSIRRMLFRAGGITTTVRSAAGRRNVGGHQSAGLARRSRRSRRSGDAAPMLSLAANAPPTSGCSPAVRPWRRLRWARRSPPPAAGRIEAARQHGVPVAAVPGASASVSRRPQIAVGYPTELPDGPLDRLAFGAADVRCVVDRAQSHGAGDRSPRRASAAGAPHARPVKGELYVDP